MDPQAPQQQPVAQQAPQPATPPPGQSPAPPEQMALLKEPVWEQVEALLKNPVLREFRIDVETDSTIRMDEDNERQARMQFIQAVSTLIGEASAVPPSMIPAAGELILFGIRGFKVARSLERVFEDAIEKLTDAPPAPNPEMQKIQMQIQADQQTAQIKADTDLKIAQAKAQLDAQVAQAQQQAQSQDSAHQNQMEMQKSTMEAQAKAQHEQAITDMKQRFEAERTQYETEAKKQIADADNATKLQIAGMQQQHEKQLEGMKQEHEQKLTAATQAHESKMAEHQAKSQEHLEGVKGENAKALAKEKPKAEPKEPKEEKGDALKELAEHLKRPRKIVRDKDGRISEIH